MVSSLHEMQLHGRMPTYNRASHVCLHHELRKLSSERTAVGDLGSL
jgi:hypothetical protein